MSNVTQDSRNSGDNRRRRSRGGQNRNNNNQNQENRRGGDRRSGEREPRGDNRDRSNNQSRRNDGNRAEEFHPQASRPARVYSQPKLSFWQKILKAVGLYKVPTAPKRPEPAPRNGGNAAQTERQPKSNTRNARSSEGSAPTQEKQARSERAERGERTERPERNRNDRQPKERPRGGNRDSVESPRVYVGNLSYEVSEQDLQELFKGIGGVRNVEIVYNRSTHRSKGYGFVEMLHMDEAIRAVEVLHDQHFMGRKLNVSGAKSKGTDEREEKEDRPEREPRKVVLAPLPPAAAVVDSAAVAEVVPVVEAPAAEVAAVEEAPATVAEDLEAKYGFDEPKKETEQA